MRTQCAGRYSSSLDKTRHGGAKLCAMTSTSRKSLSTWITCETCQATVTQKDMPGHTSECPPTFDTWKHSFILNDVLYTNPIVYKPPEQQKNLAEHELNDLVFLSHSVLQKCGIAISDPVVIAAQEKVIVKRAWPMSENTLTSVCLTKASMELNNIQGPVKVLRLKDKVFIAEDMIIVPVGKHALSEKSADLGIILKNYNEDKIFCVGNKISVPFYGRKLIYEILGCKLKQPEGCDPQCANDENLTEMLKKVDLTGHCPKLGPFYKALFSTNWVIFRPEDVYNSQKKKRIFTINDIGGYDDLIEDIKDVIDIALGKCQNIGEFCITKGVLLYGTPGVGKSMIASALISLYDAATFTIHSSDIYSKTLGVSEQRLKDIFNEAKANSPSIILIEDIDTLCPKRSNTSTDNERRVLTTLVSLFDDLQNTAQNVLVLATTSKIQFVDPSVRRPGRIDKEFEIFVPAPHMRTQILLKLLSKVPHTLTDKDVSSISFVTHGFVAADLYGLCSQAVMSAIKRQQKFNIPPEKSTVTMDDFNCALKITKPSAMKEVLVEVPDVRWSDIGGQADLKLKLKQAVEWPLRHPEAFVRMGITPPRGVLMFGPPGCSKTMIAKALATESKLNFLNIKGPELFSKWVGESEKAVREVFRKARQVAPSIIFIDEIDALGGERSSSSGSGSNVQERVLAQLLTELDGVTALGDVTLVAATNRPDKIDKALLRPGRLDRIIYVPLPDDVTRQEIFDIKLRNMPIAEDVNTNDLVDLTEGYSGAEIQAICHEAAMKALEEDLDAAVVTKEHFRAALSVVTPRTPAALVKLYDDYMNKVY